MVLQVLAMPMPARFLHGRKPKDDNGEGPPSGEPSFSPFSSPLILALSPFPSPLSSRLSRPRLPFSVLTIDRCVCRNTTFAELLPRAREEGWDLPRLIEVTGCGGQCGLCRPYLRRMLATGETSFSQILEE